MNSSGEPSEILTVDLAVVIPVYNREKLVLRCLDSVAAQKLLPAQIIVVDNASTDNTAINVVEWINNNPLEGVDVRLLTENKPGASAARNKGLESVNTSYVHFLDSDDCLVEDMTERFYSAVAEVPIADIVWWRTAKSTPRGLVERKCLHKDPFKAQIYQSFLCTQTFAVRTDFLRKVGGWDENLPCWNDWELGIRMLTHNPKLLFVDAFMTIIYPQKVSITGENRYSKAGQWEKSIDAAEKDIQNHPDCKNLWKMVNYRRLNLAALYKHEGKKDLARPLKKIALSHPGVSAWQRLILNLIYACTSRGARGGYLLFDALCGIKPQKVTHN